MTTRERWIVYPLIFLTLGIVLKDKLGERLDKLGEKLNDRVQQAEGVRVPGKLYCQELHVADEQGNDQVVLASTPEGGVVMALGQRVSPTEKVPDVYFGHWNGSAVAIVGPGGRVVTQILPLGVRRPRGPAVDDELFERPPSETSPVEVVPPTTQED